MSNKTANNWFCTVEGFSVGERLNDPFYKDVVVKDVESEPTEKTSASDPWARLDEFRSLEDGWLEGYGVAPSSDGLDWLSLFFQNVYPDDLPKPYLAPSEEGGVICEWFFRDERFDVTLDVDLQTHVAIWNALDLDCSEEQDDRLDLDSPEEQRRLFDLICSSM